MSENHARLERDLYDYEHDEPRSAGGRRHRPVADWGVGDDVFEHMPRNRFSRAAEGPPRERRFASRSETAERRGGRDADRADLEGGAPEARDVAELDAAAADRRPAADVPRGRVDDGRRTIRIGRPEDVPSEIAAITADRDIGDDPAPPPPRADTAESPPAPGERRTIRIGGRPEGSLEAT